MRLLLIAHGSRDPRYAASFEALCLRLRRQGHVARVGYLGLCGPDVVEAAQLLAGETPAACGEPIAAVPMLLNHGYHVAHDVPAAVATARAVLVSRARIAVSAPLGPDPLLIEAMESRLRALGVWPGDPDTSVVLASAGTSDPAARATLETLAAQWARTGWHAVVPAYAAAARPTAAEAVAQARSGTGTGTVPASASAPGAASYGATASYGTAASAPNVVIASYFLAPGLLADRVATAAPGVPMGAPFATPEDVDPALVRLVLRRGGQALAAAGPLALLPGAGGAATAPPHARGGRAARVHQLRTRAL
jgi:sirohydrochlorin ferrochelatase